MGQSNCQKTKNLKMKALSALVFSAWALPVVALDLGRLQILSAIGEPLRAEIEVAQASPEELRTLRAQLASPGAFNQAGMEFNPALNGVTANLQTRANGAPFIALNGRAPIQENFIDLILETQTSSGKLTKNYALLLNAVSDRAARASSTQAPVTSPQLAVLPPVIQTISQAAAPVITTVTPAPPNSQNTLNTTSVELNTKTVPVYRFALVANPKINNPAREPGDKTIKVSTGDTASRLAMRYLGGKASLDQMMLAMLKANPDAFIQGNVNLVKAGAVIRIPDVDEAIQIPREEARKTVIAQTKEFAEYARRLAESPLLVDSKNSRTMSGSVTAEASKPGATSSQQDKLTLSKSSVNTNAAEAKLASERAAKDASDQLASLNKNLKDLEALAQKPSTSPIPVAAATTLPPDAKPVEAETSSSSTPQSGALSALSLKNLSEDKRIWAWAAALLAAILLLAFWIRKKSSENEAVYAPTYDDIPGPNTDPVMGQTTGHTSIPAQMSAIDLNLQPNTSPSTVTTNPSFAAQSPTVQPASSSNAEDTEQSKLNLAAQLLVKGDKDLARALILSVVSSTHGDIKARAIQMLGQIR